MKNIYLLATTKPSVLHEFGGQFHIQTSPQENFRSYHIYITSDEQIRQGDWYLTKHKEVYKSKVIGTDNNGFHFCKKIILSTDQDLIKDGVQGISHSFLEWFVNNPTCDEVKIEKEYNEERIIDGKDFGDYRYKILIPIAQPKQELKVGDNTNFGIITDIKEYSVCFGKNFKGVDIWYKKSSVILQPKQETLSTKLHIGEVVDESYPEAFRKQETLEEAAKKEFPLIDTEWCRTDACEEENLHLLGHRKSFIKGAEYQAEQDQKTIDKLVSIIQWYDDNSDVRPDSETFMWFEQHKKK